MNRSDKTSLIYMPAKRPQARFRLFCFSYAGGSASTYLSWAGKLHHDVELAVVQLPGRGIRLVEAPLRTMEEVVDAITHALSGLQDKLMLFFGHSMGARVAYEVGVAQIRARKPEPVYFFASSCLPPNVKRPSTATYALPDKEFIEKIASLNGSAPEVLQDEEFMPLILPALRADFEILETHTRSEDTITLSARGVAIVGAQDIFTPNLLDGWRDVLLSFDGVKTVIGDHFFVDKNKQKVIDMINQVVLQNDMQVLEEYV